MKELCVVYLARAKNSIEHFRSFLQSYQLNSGGVDHDLLIIFKGFKYPQNTREYSQLLANTPHLTLEISDEGFDITAYFTAVGLHSKQYRYFCFLNSFSIIQDREWLKKLYQNISTPGVGLVGATGSWNSKSRNARAWFHSVVTEEIRHKMHTKNWTNVKNQPHSDNWLHITIAYMKAVISFIRQACCRILHIIHFSSFPNYHIRTNAFMISGDMMKTIKCPALKTKLDAHKFESASKGLTMQILNKGKRVLVVGKDGVGYEKKEWHTSKTLWLFKQENLLVADNQTRIYQEGTPERRLSLSRLAWGTAFQKNSHE